MTETVFDPSQLTALVVDPHHYQRAISAENLRALGVARVFSAASQAEAWEALCKNNPSVVLLEWLEGGDGLDLVRRIRTSDEAPNRAVSLLMLTSRGGKSDVETARAAGVDGYLRKPITALAIHKRVRAVVTKPQPFIVTATYVGPCRRRRPQPDPNHAGPWRRLDDVSVNDTLSDEDIDTNTELARARVAALEAIARDLTPGDMRGARKMFKSAQDLHDVAGQIDDPHLAFGARELLRYLQAQGATDRLDPEVARTHIAALHQLAHLPATLNSERQRVAQSLKRMVDKKLRQSAA